MREKATTIYLGPQHPGITGNMMVRLKVIGDTIVSAQTEVGYLHRAFEKLQERRNWLQSFTLMCRFCVPETDPMENVYARAVEAVEGREVPERAKYIRIAHIFRAARNFAISSKKPLCELKKNESRAPNWLGSRPLSMAAWT